MWINSLKRSRNAFISTRRAFRRPAPLVPRAAMPPAIAAIFQRLSLSSSSSTFQPKYIKRLKSFMAYMLLYFCS